METYNGKIRIQIKLYLFHISSVITFCLFAFWSCFLMLEWWKVGIQKKIYNYVFNGHPWYYESPQLYAKVMLTEGLVMVALLALLTCFIVKERNAVYVMLVAGLVYSFVTVVYNQTV